MQADGEVHHTHNSAASTASKHVTCAAAHSQQSWHQSTNPKKRNIPNSLERVARNPASTSTRHLCCSPVVHSYGTKRNPRDRSIPNSLERVARNPACTSTHAKTSSPRRPLTGAAMMLVTAASAAAACGLNNSGASEAPTPTPYTAHCRRSAWLLPAASSSTGISCRRDG